MAEKLIPGIPHATRIAILQQTDQDDQGISAGLAQDRTVLEHVLCSDESRNEAVRGADCKNASPLIPSTADTFALQVLSKAFETEDPLEPVRAIRKFRHQQAEKKLFLAHKNASLKSGARGLQARKDLKAAEVKVDATREL